MMALCWSKNDATNVLVNSEYAMFTSLKVHSLYIIENRKKKNVMEEVRADVVALESLGIPEYPDNYYSDPGDHGCDDMDPYQPNVTCEGLDSGSLTFYYQISCRSREEEPELL